MCLLRIAEIEACKDLTAGQVKVIYDTLVGAKVMNDDCYIANPDSVINYGFKTLQCARRGRQIGLVENGGVAVFWDWTHIYQAMEGKTRLGNKHWRLANNAGEMLYDPRPETQIVAELRRVFYMTFAS